MPGKQVLIVRIRWRWGVLPMLHFTVLMIRMGFDIDTSKVAKFIGEHGTEMVTR